jgi:peptidoglycan/LPS O-acetylase OafA/YrhL
MIHNLFKDYIFGLGNGVYWTLGLEEQLYALYALFLLLRWRLPAARAFLVTFAITLLWYTLAIIATLLRDSPPADWPPFGWIAWPFASWFIWTLGALAAEAYTGAITLPRWCGCGRVALIFGGLGVLFYQPVLALLHVQPLLLSLLGKDHLVMRLLNDPWILVKLGDYALALCFFILLNRWIVAEVNSRCRTDWQSVTPQGRHVAWLAAVGVFSYSLYLTHYPVIRLADWALEGVLAYNIAATLIRYAIYVPLCLGVAYGFFKLIESRFLYARRPEVHASPHESVLGKAA